VLFLTSNKARRKTVEVAEPPALPAAERPAGRSGAGPVPRPLEAAEPPPAVPLPAGKTEALVTGIRQSIAKDPRLPGLILRTWLNSKAQ
jgi:hypothetical protein